MRHLDEGVLQAWLDGRRSGLSPDERAGIEGHVSSCDACARRLRELERTSRRVETLLAAPGPEDESFPGYDAVVARADRRRISGRRLGSWTAAAWAASVAAAMGAGWIANDLYGTRGVVRTSASGAETDSPRPVPVVIRAEPFPDTGSPVLFVAAPPSGTEVRPVADAGAAVELAAAGASAAVPDRDGILVRGQVTDEAGRPLESAQVLVDGTAVGSLTRPDGTFRLWLDAPPTLSSERDLTVAAELIGYGRGRRAFSVRPGDSISADFRLARSAVALEGIVVTGVDGPARPDLRGSIGPVPATPPEIEAFPGISTSRAWRAATRAEAEAVAGFRLLSVPDLPVVGIELGHAEGVTLVRVVQALEDGNRLELVQAASEVPTDEGLASGDRVRVAVRRGDVHVVATASGTREALEVLLDRLNGVAGSG